MKRFSVDRIEGLYAICESDDYDILEIKLCRFPDKVTEGDVIIIKDDDTIVIDKEETQRRRDQVINLKNKLMKKDKKN